MPIILMPQVQGKFGSPGIVRTLPRLDYDYPHGVDFSPQGKLHNNIVARLLQIADESHSIMTQRHESWGWIDEMLTAFIPTSDYEDALKRRGGGDNQQFHGRTRPVSVVVPYSYATFETIMTYYMQAFFNSPLFQYIGAGGEDTVNAKLLELAVDAQARRFKAALAMHTSLGDGLKYGLGATTFTWHQLWGKRTVATEREHYTEDGDYTGSSVERTQEDHLLFEGNKLHPIDPYRILPDPNVSISDFQDGEFFGWIDIPSYYEMLEEERDDETIFNVKYLNVGEMRQVFSRYTTDLSSRERKYTGSATGQGIKTNYTNRITNVNMYVKLLPKEWKLPGNSNDNKNGEYPETWLFTVSNDTILTRAARHNLNHQMYPAAVNAPDADGYTVTPISRMEMLHGLQEGMNWLYNSHIANVRKAINDMFIVDPSLIVMKDLRDPEPGKLVRLRRRAWGRGVDDAVKQLTVSDVTRGNIADSMYLMDIMQRVSAAVDAVQGIVRSGGERRSATEYRMTVSNALSRLEHLARIASLQYLHDMSYMMASHTQQFLSQPIFTQVVGEWPEVLSKIYQRSRGIMVSPEEISIDYDVVVRDGSVPTAGVANADLYVQLFQIVGSQPELMKQFDIVRLFTRIATMLGDRNAYDFIRKGGDINAMTAPDEQVEALAQAGNLVPLAA